MPFSVSWTGAVRIVTPGSYKCEAQGTGAYTVRLDGAELVDATHAARVPDQPGRAAPAERTLTAGLHELQAHWTCPKPAQGTRRQFQLYWTPPDGQRELIPPPNFVPAAPAAAVPPTSVPRQ